MRHYELGEYYQSITEVSDDYRLSYCRAALVAFHFVKYKSINLTFAESYVRFSFAFCVGEKPPHARAADHCLMKRGQSNVLIAADSVAPNLGNN